MCPPRRLILHLVPPVAMATRPPRSPYAVPRLKSVEGAASVSPHLLGVSVADGDRRWRRARPVQWGGVGVGAPRPDHGAVMRGAPNKKGIRYSQDANAGVAFQPAVTVSGALARIPCCQSTSHTSVRQEKIRAGWVSHLTSGPNDSATRVTSETENGRATRLQMTLPRRTRKSLYLTQAIIMLIMALAGH